MSENNNDKSFINKIKKWILKQTKETLEDCKNHWNDFLFLILLGVAVYLIWWAGKKWQVYNIVLAWGFISLIMVAYVSINSALIESKGHFLGWLINKQGRVSLSQLQMFMWTIVILSAYATAVLAHLRFHNFEKALSINIPSELWFAMGISLTSLAGSKVILVGKEEKVKKDYKDQKILVRADKNKGAHFSDLITGEEEGNKDKIDLSRLQNLFFTFILVVTYIASLRGMFAKFADKMHGIDNIAENSAIILQNLEVIQNFPELGSGAFTLLAISHAGYLAVKAIDKQPTIKA